MQLALQFFVLSMFARKRNFMIFCSRYPDISIPEQALTELVLQRAVELVDKPALIKGLIDRILTYGQLSDFIHRVTSSLAACGFSKGDVWPGIGSGSSVKSRGSVCVEELTYGC